ncbi:MT-A70 family methyltransferase [Mycobacteroides abscessus]|uniref:S-adenosylmethionine-binding protein n=1 Tax=Mycobacteroides franklinii TaxID=948102 RepID=A0A4R5PF56_9MYCO|nr:hypothetical protein BST24_01550 [Mycobacteroides franklinii]TDH23671.1 S-adenosylmethionine-binding protein [Mycobacteroides franklinii]SLB99346.1 Transcriptional activator, adenine-specific DNA methyltransferase [Mycobacteroides abscessus subsp. abscessus]SLG10350.1 Transcriptional activator, adenine-specific DNA methyltransferase [Mycobacteroides abscessus subsp. abscessus]
MTEFRTVVADPPWRYENRASRAAAENHYETMTTTELCELRVVREHAARDSHLYLWVTNSHLADGLKVMSEWGFEYKTTITWVKPQMGMGNYFRSGTELVLFGVRGGLPTLRRDIRNHFTAPRRAHSQKPREFLELVVASSPGPYLELFSRCSEDASCAATTASNALPAVMPAGCAPTATGTRCPCGPCLITTTSTGSISPPSENPHDYPQHTKHARRQ